MRAIVLAAILAGCLPATQPSTMQPAYSAPAAAHTWVYLNGQELTVDQKAQLDTLVGAAIPAGRYWVDAQGNAGVEGQPAQVNLYVLARQRDARRGAPVNIYSTDTAGRGSSLVSDGHCTIASTPEMTLATGGC